MKPSKKNILTISLLIILAVLVFMIYRDMNPAREYQYHLRAPSECVIANTALEIAGEVFPDMNPGKYSDMLYQMAGDIQARIKEESRPSVILDTIMDYILREKGFGYDYSDLAQHKASNRFLNGTLDTKKGACFTMPLLFLCLTERLQLPVYGVCVPEHFILRWDDGSYRVNIEVTGGGGPVPDEDYIRDFHILDSELRSGCFLRTLTTKEVQGLLYESRGGYYAEIGKKNLAIRDYEKAVELNPRLVEAWRTLLIFYDEKKCMISPRSATRNAKNSG